MSEPLLIAIVGLVGSILGGFIAAFGALAAVESKRKEGTATFSGCGVIGLTASAGSAIGLVLGLLFAVFIVQHLGLEKPSPGKIDQPLRTQEPPPTQIVIVVTATPPLYAAQPTATVSQPEAATAKPAAIPSSPPRVQPITPQVPQPVSLGTIRIPGNSNQGIQIRIDQSGYYMFRYVSGAYSTYPLNQSPSGTKTWLTAVLIFKGPRALWEGESVKGDSSFARVADTAYWSSAQEAENASRGMITRASLNKGDVLTLIAVDGQSYYSDNPGEVTLELLILGD